MLDMDISMGSLSYFLESDVEAVKLEVERNRFTC